MIITTIILLWLPLTHNQVHAFWAENISYNQVSVTATVAVGDWLEFEAVYWEPDPEENFQEGDVVFWEGEYYVRTKFARGLNVEPGGFLSWLVWNDL